MEEDWSIFGFLYGTIPPAPPTVIYAAAFGIQEDLVNIVMISISNHRSIFSHCNNNSSYYLLYLCYYIKCEKLFFPLI